MVIEIIIDLLIVLGSVFICLILIGIFAPLFTLPIRDPEKEYRDKQYRKLFREK